MLKFLSSPSGVVSRCLDPMKTRPTSFLRLLLIQLGLMAVGVHAAAPLARPASAIENPPPVQLLVPGFTVRELPLALRNLNNLVYAPDGRLFALGYDGNVHQLKDTDGDGLEDTSTLFFDNTRAEIPPSIGMAWGPGGLYIASRGRVIHLRDKGDGTAELQTVTGGWLPPTAAAGSNLDAIGLAVDPAGNIYFGLGVDAGSVDGHGRPHLSVLPFASRELSQLSIATRPASASAEVCRPRRPRCASFQPPESIAAPSASSRSTSSSGSLIVTLRIMPVSHSAVRCLVSSVASSAARSTSASALRTRPRSITRPAITPPRRCA